MTAPSDRPGGGIPGCPPLAPGRVTGPGQEPDSRPTALLAVVASLSGARAALGAGADMVDLGAASPDTIRAVQAQLAGPDRIHAVVCATGPPADIVRDVAAARETGAVALCDGIEAARGSGLPASQVLVEVPPWLIAEVSADGWGAVVDADRGAFLARLQSVPEWPGPEWPSSGERTGNHDDSAALEGAALEEAALEEAALAIAAVSSWLGATVVRTRHAAAARRALDMTASIRGLRPPARAVRGLA